MAGFDLNVQLSWQSIGLLIRGSWDRSPPRSLASRQVQSFFLDNKLIRMESGAKPTQWWQMTIIHIFQSMIINKKELRSSSLLFCSTSEKYTPHTLKMLMAQQSRYLGSQPSFGCKVQESSGSLPPDQRFESAHRHNHLGKNHRRRKSETVS